MTDIDGDTARQDLALNLAVIASNFAGLKPHQYQSAAVDVCTKMVTIVGKLNKWGLKDKRRRESWRHIVA